MEASSALTFAETNPIHLASRVVDEPSKAEFDDYAQRYREAVQDSISFARTDHDVFTAAKAEALLELIRSGSVLRTGSRCSTSVAGQARRTGS